MPSLRYIQIKPCLSLEPCRFRRGVFDPLILISRQDAAHQLPPRQSCFRLPGRRYLVSLPLLQFSI